MAKDPQGASLRASIVSYGGMFVNAYPHFAAYLFVILCLEQVAFTQNPDSRDRSSATTSPVFQEATQRLGPSSKLVWAEPGSSSLERWTARSLIEIEGVVVSWDPKQLVVLKADASGPTTFPGDLVVGITPGWKSEAYSQAHQSFVVRDFQKMIQQGQAALAQREIPRWQQRVLASEMVEASMAISLLLLQKYSQPLRRSPPLPYSFRGFRCLGQMSWRKSLPRLPQMPRAGWIKIHRQ